jgi:signal peptidase I
MLNKAHVWSLATAVGCVIVMESTVCTVHVVADDMMQPTLKAGPWGLSDVCLVDKVTGYLKQLPIERGEIVQLRCGMPFA